MQRTSHFMPSDALPPPAFLCTASRQVMDDPALSLCGHLFDRSVLAETRTCPIDQAPLAEDRFIGLGELRTAITAWKTQQQTTNVWHTRSIDSSCSSSSSSSSSTSSPNLNGLDLQMGRMRITTMSPLRVLENAHYDDIHGFIPWKNGFISGSKDNTIRMWNHDGLFVKELKPGGIRGYEYWITALCQFSNGFWASGTRNGEIAIWDQSGNVKRQMQYNPRRDHVCKDRNKARINCIAELYSNDNTTMFYTGTPKYIQLWNASKAKLVQYYEADVNDWVYCIEKLPESRLVVVYGSTMQVWKMVRDRDPERSNLIVEDRSRGFRGQREHISAISLLQHNTNQLSAAVFDGTVRLVDLTSQRTFRTYKEHHKRVWSVVNLQDHLIASSADDSTIKIWDVRTERSIHTIGDNPGRVSSLLRLDEQTLISGSCPDKVFESVEKASISFWDIRTLTSRDQ